MSTESLEAKCRELEARIRVLELENDRLVERAEDVALLGLVGESIAGVDDSTAVLGQVLEKMSLLKDIPYSAYGRRDGGEVELVQAYASFREDGGEGDHLTLSSDVVRALDAGDRAICHGDCETIGISLHVAEERFAGNCVALFPVTPRSLGDGLFVFANDEPQGERLAGVAEILQRTVELTTARLDNIALLRELRELNANLDRQVAERTAELRAANERLRESEERYRRIVELSFDGIMIHQEGQMVFADPRGAKLLGAEDAEQLVGLPVMEVVHPDYRGLVAERLKQVSAGEEATLVEEKLVQLDGTVFDAEVAGLPITYQNKPAVHVVIRDISERKRAEEALLRRVQEVATLNALGRQVGASLSLDRVVRAALVGVGKALAPDLSLIFLREGDDLILQGFDAPDPRFRHEETPAHRVGECLCGLAVRQAKTLYSKDIHNDSRCTWEECKKAGLRSLAALPLRSGDEVIGVLGIASASERDFAERAAFLEALAGQVALGIENARLYEQVQRHAEELEQRVRERTVELQRFVNLMAGREVRMAELKDVIRELRAQLEAADLKPVADNPLAGSGG